MLITQPEDYPRVKEPEISAESLLKPFKRAIADSERVSFSRRVSGLVNQPRSLKVDLPGRQGYMPTVERRLLIGSVLSGRPPRVSLRYSPQKVELDQQVLSTREEVEKGIPPVGRVAIFLRADMNILLDYQKEKSILDRADQALAAIPELIQELTRISVDSLNVSACAVLETLTGRKFDLLGLALWQTPENIDELIELWRKGLPSAYRDSLRKILDHPPVEPEVFLVEPQELNVNYPLEIEELYSLTDSEEVNEGSYLPAGIHINIFDQEPGGFSIFEEKGRAMRSSKDERN